MSSRSGEFRRVLPWGGTRSGSSARRPDGYPELIKIDPRFDVVAPGRRLLPGGDPQPYARASVAAGPDGVWAAAEGGSLEHLDPAGKAVTARIDTGNSLASVAIGAGAVWASDSHGNTVARIDPATEPRDRDDPGRKRAGRGGGGRRGRSGWPTGVDGAVVRIDPATNSVTTTIPVGRGPTGIAVGLGSVWVANSRDGTVSRIDPAPKQGRADDQGGRKPAGDRGRERPGLGVRPDRARSGPASRRRRLARRVHWNRLARSCNRLHVRLLDDPVRDLRRTCSTTRIVRRRRGRGSFPEVAAAMPTRSADGKSYTFTIRPGFRFSPPSNAPVTAQTFKFSIERALSPKIPDGPARSFAADIVGVQAYEAGKAKHISGISVRGNTLTVRLTDVSPDIVSRLAQPLFCPVPLGTPVEATGVNTVPSAGPYYVASYRPEQGAVLKRNPNYHGPRPHAFDEIDYEASIGAAQNVREIEAGTSDFAVVGDLPATQLASLAARYGPGSPAARAGRQRYFVNPLLGFVYLALNTSRPLFANADLRKAVNYALDRRAIASRTFGPADRPVSPCQASPASATRTSTRSRRISRRRSGLPAATEDAPSSMPASNPSTARWPSSSRPSLRRSGSTSRSSRSLASPWATSPEGAASPSTWPWSRGTVAYPDPSNILNYLFDGRSIRATANSNLSYFDDPAYNRKLAAAARLTGPQRYAAYQALEADLLRNAAPAAPLFNFAESEFFSARIGCQVYQPVYQIDLAALCLKSR